MPRQMLLAWDLGQANDASIVMVSELTNGVITVTDVHKLPERTSYVDQCEMVAELMKTHHASLILDKTGSVGVADMVKKKGIIATEVMWTGGSKESRDGNKINLPKEQGVMAVTLALQSGKLKVTQFCRNRELLRKEMQEFGVKYGANGKCTYDGVSSHDDTVSALMLTCYFWSKQVATGRKYQILGAQRGRGFDWG